MFALRTTLIALAAACGVACTPRDNAAVRAHDRDDYGDPIVFGTNPQRVVSLNPATTETLFAMGASARLIGRSHWDYWPDSARLIPDLGNALRPNVEAIIAAHPDLVILYASADNRSAARQLRAVGIRTLSFKIDRLETFDRATRLMGRVLGDSARGAIVADSVQRTVQRVRAATASLPHPTVVWPFAYRPVMVVGGGSFMTELLEIAGAQNIYAALPDPSPIVTLEDVVQRNPTYMIRSVDRTQEVTQTKQLDAAWMSVPAVRAGRILTAPGELVSRPSVRFGEAAVALARMLHLGIVIQ